jgi:hypothetical protein
MHLQFRQKRNKVFNFEEVLAWFGTLLAKKKKKRKKERQKEKL